MIETLQAAGVDVFPFAYPYDRDPELLRLQIRRMADHFGTTAHAAEEVRASLAGTRALLAELDRLTWEEGRVSGQENHYYLVSASDFCSDVEGFAAEVRNLLGQAHRRPVQSSTIRLGIIGVPPIMTNLYETIESLGVSVVFNEVQRQFSMIAHADRDLLGQYLSFTYPYDVFGRIEDINAEIARRRIDGIIHYVQTFCFRQIQDIMFKRRLAAPVLTIEGDRPVPVDARSRLRLEAFVESLQARRALSASTDTTGPE